MSIQSFFKALFLLSTLGVVAGCSEEAVDETSEKPLRPVRVMEVVESNNAFGKEFIAVADASRKADLSFRIAGELVEFPVNQGDKVKKGQILSRLSDKDMQVQFRDAEASFKKAESDFTRGKKLVKANTISKADFDQLKAQFGSAKAKFDAAKNNLAYTRLKAPFSGVIAKKHTENFQEVNAKQVIVSLHDLSRIKLKINIPESVMIKSGQKPPKVIAKFESLGDTEFDLKFEEIATQPDEVTKTYEVTLSMKAPEGYNILPGMTARVRAFKDASERAREAKIFLPAKVVLEDSSGNFVYTISDNNDGTATVVKAPVRAGKISQSGIEILSGVATGDLVVTAGMSKVSDGMKVRF